MISHVPESQRRSTSWRLSRLKCKGAVMMTFRRCRLLMTWIFSCSIVMGCGGEKESALTGPTEAIQSATIAQLADEVASGVGSVKDVGPASGAGSIYVFEEFHTSRVGQLEIAVMLHRLYEKAGLRLIGLEGDLQSLGPLDVSWFHGAGGTHAEEVREDVALRMLSEGEISAPEFIALVHHDVVVQPLEKAAEYDFVLDVESNPAVQYLILIAQEALSEVEILRINRLAEEGKTEEALNALVEADPWVKSKWEALTADVYQSEDMAAVLQSIQKRANEERVSVPATAEQDLRKTLEFFEMASRRSHTMASRLHGLEAKTKAIIIGAAHSSEVVRVLRDGAVVALMSPNSLNPEYATLSMEEFERKNKKMWASMTSGSLGALLNGGLRKPPPILRTTTGMSYANGLLVAKLLSEAARDGRELPGALREEIDRLENVRMDWSSLSVDGYDVLFRMWLVDTMGDDVEVWSRVGTAESEGESQSLEEKLLQRIADLGGSGNIPPRKPPNNTVGTGSEEGPGDGKRNEIRLARVGESVMTFAENKATVEQMGRVSG